MILRLESSRVSAHQTAVGNSSAAQALLKLVHSDYGSDVFYSGVLTTPIGPLAATAYASPERVDVWSYKNAAWHNLGSVYIGDAAGVAASGVVGPRDCLSPCGWQVDHFTDAPVDLVAPASGADHSGLAILGV